MEASMTTLPGIVVYITVPNKEAGKKLAEHLLNERLATCVNRIPGVESVYDRKAEIQTDSKELLVIKTRESLLEGLMEHVKANHEYGLFSDFQRPSKKQKGLKNVWCVKEDVALMSSWVFVAQDNMSGNNRKGVSLWARVHRLYHEKQAKNPNELNQRNIDSIKGRWKRLSANGDKWVAAYKEADARKRSGMSPKEVENEAHSIYEAGGSKFQDLVVFNEVMCKHPKWDLTLLHDAPRPPPENEGVADQESGGSSKRSRTSEDGENSASESGLNNGFAEELRALRASREREVEMLRNVSNAKIELEREKLQMANRKMNHKLLNTLLTRDHLSPADEEIKRKLMTIVFK